MTRPFEPNKLQFYVTMPAPCPYLPDRMERKVFTQLDPFSGPHLNDWLTQIGFRRSQNVIYRPACENCQACKSLRVLAQEYEFSRNDRKVLNRNSDLFIDVCEPKPTDEQFALLQRYLNERHVGGGMSDMDFDRYSHMVEECASRTDILEYRNTDGRLVAALLMDTLADGLSMVYSFYDPEEYRRSLGKFMILDRIRACQREGLPHLYLGFWVKGSQKMDYKAKYKPYQILIGERWIRDNELGE